MEACRRQYDFRFYHSGGFTLGMFMPGDVASERSSIDGQYLDMGRGVDLMSAVSVK